MEHSGGEPQITGKQVVKEGLRRLRNTFNPSISSGDLAKQVARSKTYIFKLAEQLGIEPKRDGKGKHRKFTKQEADEIASAVKTGKANTPRPDTIRARLTRDYLKLRERLPESDYPNAATAFAELFRACDRIETTAGMNRYSLPKPDYTTVGNAELHGWKVFAGEYHEQDGLLLKHLLADLSRVGKPSRIASTLSNGVVVMVR
jgi:hypothetical protein